MTGYTKSCRSTRTASTVLTQLLGGLVLASCAVLCCGCGGGASDTPELGQVSGTVTLDGQPLAGANLEFVPQEGGRPSVGTTDEAGHYELRYSQDEPGAKVGTHTVSIRTFSYSAPDVPEKLPAKYNAQTTLTATVKPGENTTPFDLQTK
jgi:hypothetical protein